MSTGRDDFLAGGPGATIALVPTKPDIEVAAELRARAEAALEPMCRLMDEAKALGFAFGFNLAPDYRQRHVIANLDIIKKF